MGLSSIDFEILFIIYIIKVIIIFKTILMATLHNSHNIAKPGTRGPDANPATSMGYARLLHSQDSYRHKYNATQG